MTEIMSERQLQPTGIQILCTTYGVLRTTAGNNAQFAVACLLYGVDGVLLALFLPLTLFS